MSRLPLAIAVIAARLRRDRRGIAAIEFAMMAGMLAVGLLNTVDLAFYMYTRMEVENAAEMGVQAAWNICTDQTTMLPATQNCAGLNTAIGNAIKGSSLGTSVTLVTGSPVEGYYCVNTYGQLQSVGSLNNKPADCSAAGNAALRPADYLQVSVTYDYAPLFPGITIMSASGITTITMTSWMRLG
jgi:Flp pilus assembly protein TadG